MMQMFRPGAVLVAGHKTGGAFGNLELAGMDGFRRPCRGGRETESSCTSSLFAGGTRAVLECGVTGGRW